MRVLDRADQMIKCILLVSVEHSAEQYVKSHTMDDIIGDNKASKVCTIL